MGKKALGIVSVAALTAVLALFAWPAGDFGEPPPDRGGPGLPGESREVASERLSERLLVLTFASDGLDPPLREAKVRVLLPTGYRSSQRRYPVLYLLHGAGDRYSA